MTRKMKFKRYKEMSSLERYRHYGISDERLQRRIENAMTAIEDKGVAFALKDAYKQTYTSSTTSDDINLDKIVIKLLKGQELSEEENVIAEEYADEIEEMLKEGD